MRRTTTFALLAIAMLAAAPAAAQSHLLVVSGLGGEPRLREEFHAWSTSMVTTARERLGVPAENITYLGEDPSRAPGLMSGESTRENVEGALIRLAERAGPNDRILILLIGHGNSDDRGARINLPGPDITADRLAELLDRFPTQRVAVVNAASASGAFVEPLAGDNRAIIAATKTGHERNETVFARYFVDAFAGGGADIDKDGRVTLLEAFDFAAAEVERFYRGENRLQTETPVLEGDRELARGFALGGGAARGGGATATSTAAASPELRGLVEERQALEAQVEALRDRRDAMEEAAYERELERLLLELARKNQEIRQREGGR